jgi:succinate dehydrogenase / fumarate reductase iron-sulfur subunit
MRHVTYRIDRYDGSQSFTQEYSFPHQPGKTLLWGLMHIKETLDPSLTFVASCRCAVCGACAVRVNGQAMLACETSLDGLLERFGDTLAIGPLRNFKVIRDLVVDWRPKTRRMAEVKPWLLPRETFSRESGCTQTPDEFGRIKGQINCILCGACASECNKLSADSEDFLDPFVFSKVQRFVADSRDGGAMEHLLPALEQGLWKCVHCQECVTKCPKSLEPAEDIARLRRLAIGQGLTGSPGARHALAFAEDQADPGRLNEMTMAIRTEGLLKSATRLPFALRLLRKGKLNPFQGPSQVKGIEQVRRIVQALKKGGK